MKRLLLNNYASLARPCLWRLCRCKGSRKTKGECLSRWHRPWSRGQAQRPRYSWTWGSMQGWGLNRQYWGRYRWQRGREGKKSRGRSRERRIRSYDGGSWLRWAQWQRSWGVGALQISGSQKTGWSCGDAGQTLPSLWAAKMLKKLRLKCEPNGGPYCGRGLRFSWGDTKRRAWWSRRCQKRR